MAREVQVLLSQRITTFMDCPNQVPNQCLNLHVYICVYVCVYYKYIYFLASKRDTIQCSEWKIAIRVYICMYIYYRYIHVHETPNCGVGSKWAELSPTHNFLWVV